VFLAAAVRGVEQAEGVRPGGGLGAGGGAELAEELETCTLAVFGEMKSKG
jgi:hypothetical protein